MKTKEKPGFHVFTVSQKQQQRKVWNDVYEFHLFALMSLIRYDVVFGRHELRSSVPKATEGVLESKFVYCSSKVMEN